MKTSKLDIKKPSSDLGHIKIAVVSTNWNEEIIKPMLEDCLTVLEEYNLEKKSFVVPGAYELPFIAQVLSKNYDAIILLGCIINCLLYTSPSPRDMSASRMPSSA